MKKRVFITFVICLLSLAVITGCAERRTEPTEFMAWSFAQGTVTRRMAQPGKTFYPEFRPEFVERQGRDVFVIRAFVSTVDAQGKPVAYNFSVTAKYQGNNVFEATAVEITPQ